MGRMVDGEWVADAGTRRDADGGFVREQTVFRDWIGPEEVYPVAAGRYHVYVSHACPWSHGVVLARSVLGLQDAVTMDAVDPVRRSDGWAFSPEKTGCTADTVNGSSFLREVYRLADASYTGRVTVPVLWDKQEGTIVNNESVEIMRMFATGFTPLGDPGVDVYPADRREAIDAVINEIYDPVNNGVYRAGFAATQSAYSTAVREVFEKLDELDDRLSATRYLVGERLSLADLRLFQTLVRFDPVYHYHFKCNLRRLVEYPSLWGYTKDVYQHPRVGKMVDLEQIRTHYYRSHTSLNPRGIIPVGPEIDYTAPHARDETGGYPE